MNIVNIIAGFTSDIIKKPRLSENNRDFSGRIDDYQEKKSRFLKPAVRNLPKARAFVSHMIRALFLVFASIFGAQ